MEGKEFANASNDCRKICDILKKEDGINIAYEYDQPNDAPSFTNFYVRFNGIGDEGHETFLIHKRFDNDFPQFDDDGKRAFAFCKTAYKPYDLAVCCCLIIFKHWFPDMKVCSDGTMEDWQTAIDRVKDVLGKDYIKHFELNRD